MKYKVRSSVFKLPLTDFFQTSAFILQTFFRLQTSDFSLCMLLTTTPEAEAVEAARYLLEQAQQQAEEAIINLVTTIILYKFSTLSREEIEAMLGLISEEPRAIREAREEGERKLVLRQLNRRVGAISDELQRQIQALSLEQVEVLGEALLDFSSMADLEAWLQSQQR